MLQEACSPSLGDALGNVGAVCHGIQNAVWAAGIIGWLQYMGGPLIIQLIPP